MPGEQPKQEERQFTAEELKHFSNLGIERPDPNKNYTVKELEAARDEHIRTVENNPTHPKKELVRTEASRACEYLTDRLVSKRQKSANEESGTNESATESEYTQAIKRYEKKRKTFEKLYRPQSIQANSFVTFMLMNAFFPYKIAPAYSGPDPTPQPTEEEIEIASKRQGQYLKDDKKLQEICQKYADRAHIELEHENPNDPTSKVVGARYKDAPTGATADELAVVDKARYELHKEMREEVGFKPPESPSGFNLPASPAPK